MSTIEKLIARFMARPNDFTWSELVRLLKYFGFDEITGSGSRRKFIHHYRQPIILHEPHPRRILKMYQINQIYDALKEEQLI
jgi:predicted RNA binding protein YcfA (HicA-like mRNA interferase family)